MAQSESVNLFNNPARRAYSYNPDNDDLPARNHGTGVRVGSSWELVKGAFRHSQVPASFEAGVFHQRAVSRVVSLQGEVLYYRASSAEARGSNGLRVPAMLVINPFYNVSIHLGPQLQWRTGQATYPTRDAAVLPRIDAPSPRITAGVVAGGEARIGFLRVGMRYHAPVNALYDLPETGR